MNQKRRKFLRSKWILPTGESTEKYHQILTKDLQIDTDFQNLITSVHNKKAADLQHRKSSKKKTKSAVKMSTVRKLILTQSKKSTKGTTELRKLKPFFFYDEKFHL